MNQTEIMLQYQSLDSRERGKLRLVNSYEFDPDDWGASALGFGDTALPLSRTTQCINQTGKFGEQTSLLVFRDVASVFSDLRVDNVSPD